MHRLWQGGPFRCDIRISKSRLSRRIAPKRRRDNFLVRLRFRQDRSSIANLIQQRSKVWNTRGRRFVVAS